MTRKLPWANAKVFNSKVRRNIKLAEAPSHGTSIFQYAPTSAGALDYQSLVLEVIAAEEGRQELEQRTAA